MGKTSRKHYSRKNSSNKNKKSKKNVKKRSRKNKTNKMRGGSNIVYKISNRNRIGNLSDKYNYGYNKVNNIYFISKNAKAISRDLQLEDIIDDLQNNNVQIDRVDLSENQITDKEAKQIAEAINNNTSLIYLNMSNNNIGDAGAQALATALELAIKNGNKKLKELDLRNNNITDEGKKVFNDLRKDTGSELIIFLENEKEPDPELLLLEYGYTSNSDTYSINNTISKDPSMQLNKLFEMLKNDEPNLTKLDLSFRFKLLINKYKSFNKLPQQLAKILEKNTTLIELNISHNDIGDNKRKQNNNLSKEYLGGVNMLYFANVLRLNNTLTKLDMSGNSIDDGGAETLAEAIKVNKTLTELNISTNNISNEGAIHLFNAIKVNNTLEKLDICLNQIGLNTINAKNIIRNTNQTNANYERAIKNADLEALKISKQLSIKFGNVFEEALLKNTALIDLNISYNDLENNMANHLKIILINNETLVKIDISNNYFDMDAKQMIEQGIKYRESMKTPIEIIYDTQKTPNISLVQRRLSQFSIQGNSGNSGNSGNRSSIVKSSRGNAQATSMKSQSNSGSGSGSVRSIEPSLSSSSVPSTPPSFKNESQRSKKNTGPPSQPNIEYTPSPVFEEEPESFTHQGILSRSNSSKTRKLLTREATYLAIGDPVKSVNKSVKASDTGYVMVGDEEGKENVEEV